MQNLDEVSDRSLPYIKRVLPRRPGTNVLAVAGKTTLLPHRFVDEVLKFLIGFDLCPCLGLENWPIINHFTLEIILPCHNKQVNSQVCSLIF